MYTRLLGDAVGAPGVLGSLVPTSVHGAAQGPPLQLEPPSPQDWNLCSVLSETPVTNIVRLLGKRSDDPGILSPPSSSCSVDTVFSLAGENQGACVRQQIIFLPPF